MGSRSQHFKQTPSVILIFTRLRTTALNNWLTLPPCMVTMWTGMPVECELSKGFGSSLSEGCTAVVVAFQVLPGFSLRSCPITIWNWRGTAWKNWELNASVSGLSSLWWTTRVFCGTFTVFRIRAGSSTCQAVLGEYDLMLGRRPFPRLQLWMEVNERGTAFQSKTMIQETTFTTLLNLDTQCAITFLDYFCITALVCYKVWKGAMI